MDRVEAVDSVLRGGTHGDNETFPVIDIGKATLSFKDLLSIEIPERKKLLPWLPEGGLCMVSSPRALGKNLFRLEPCAFAYQRTTFHEVAYYSAIPGLP